MPRVLGAVVGVTFVSLLQLPLASTGEREQANAGDINGLDKIFKLALTLRSSNISPYHSVNLFNMVPRQAPRLKVRCVVFVKHKKLYLTLYRWGM